MQWHVIGMAAFLAVQQLRAFFNVLQLQALLARPNTDATFPAWKQPAFPPPMTPLCASNPWPTKEISVGIGNSSPSSPFLSTNNWNMEALFRGWEPQPTNKKTPGLMHFTAPLMSLTVNAPSLGSLHHGEVACSGPSQTSIAMITWRLLFTGFISENCDVKNPLTSSSFFHSFSMVCWYFMRFVLALHNHSAAASGSDELALVALPESEL